jgi:hypothetical protein
MAMAAQAFLGSAWSGTWTINIYQPVLLLLALAARGVVIVVSPILVFVSAAERTCIQRNSCLLAK